MSPIVTMHSSTHVLGYGWKFANLPLCGFYIFFSKRCQHFLGFPTSLLYPWPFKETIPNDYWFKLVFYVSGLFIIRCVYWVWCQSLNGLSKTNDNLLTSLVTSKHVPCCNYDHSMLFYCHSITWQTWWLWMLWTINMKFLESIN
jgi:hypothetical protein